SAGTRPVPSPRSPRTRPRSRGPGLMSTEKRLVLFLVLSVASMYGMQILLDRLGMIPKPPERPAAVGKADAPEDADADADVKPAEPAEVARAGSGAEAPAEDVDEDASPDEDDPRRPEVDLANPAELVLGSTDPASPY